jgi:hypothetical protein
VFYGKQTNLRVVCRDTTIIYHHHVSPCPTLEKWSGWTFSLREVFRGHVLSQRIAIAVGHDAVRGTFQESSRFAHFLFPACSKSCPVKKCMTSTRYTAGIRYPLGVVEEKRKLLVHGILGVARVNSVKRLAFQCSQIATLRACASQSNSFRRFCFRPERKVKYFSTRAKTSKRGAIIENKPLLCRL